MREDEPSSTRGGEVKDDATRLFLSDLLEQFRVYIAQVLTSSLEADGGPWPGPRDHVTST